VRDVLGRKRVVAGDKGGKGKVKWEEMMPELETPQHSHLIEMGGMRKGGDSRTQRKNWCRMVIGRVDYLGGTTSLSGTGNFL